MPTQGIRFGIRRVEVRSWVRIEHGWLERVVTSTSCFNPQRLKHLSDEFGLTVEQIAIQALVAYERRSRKTGTLWDAVRAIQEDVQRRGVKLTKREIDAEIKAARAELKLQMKKVTSEVS